ncbi:MAG TPA: DUF4019 domain-containing protein [Bryobacteraceae bacterium]|nr:DUF4019 domain-containing protein [Bryobacteraceae bacterium]
MTRRTCFVVVAAAPFLGAQDPGARVAADRWLALVDQGKYKDAWKQTSQFHKPQITGDEWQAQIRSMRGAVGAVKERKFTTARTSKELPGAPDGDYTILEFSTAFEKKAKAVEILVLSREGNSWRQAGYSIS